MSAAVARDWRGRASAGSQTCAFASWTSYPGGMMPTMRVGVPSIGIDAPDDRFVAAERGAPDFARQDRHVFRAGQRVGPRELPAAERGDAEHGHQLGRDSAELTRRGWSAVPRLTAPAR